MDSYRLGRTTWSKNETLLTNNNNNEHEQEETTYKLVRTKSLQNNKVAKEFWQTAASHVAVLMENGNFYDFLLYCMLSMGWTPPKSAISSFPMRVSAPSSSEHPKRQTDRHHLYSICSNRPLLASAATWPRMCQTGHDNVSSLRMSYRRASGDVTSDL